MSAAERLVLGEFLKHLPNHRNHRNERVSLLWIKRTISYLIIRVDFHPLPPLKHLTPRSLPSLPSTAYHGDGGIYHPWNSSLPGCLQWEQRECWHTSIKLFHGHGWIGSRPTLCFVRYIKRIKELTYKTTLPKVREKAVILEIVLILDCPFTSWYWCKAVDFLLDVVRVYVYDCLDRLLLMSEEE